MHRRNPRAQCAGVTLIEMVIVISITAIIAGTVALFISRPVEMYADTARRAELTDRADTALRRMTRELRTALPNSIRVVEFPASSGVWYLEFLPVSAGGRYRAEPEELGGGNILDFVNPAGDSAFDVIGAPPGAANPDWIVVYNLHASGPDANAYAGDNRATVSSIAGNTVTLTASHRFPFASPGNRFQVVKPPVTYSCNPTTGVLTRHWGYTIAAAQGTPPAGATTAVLAGDIAFCRFTYQTSPASLRTGVVQLEIRIARDGEVVRLFQQVHVNNAP